MYVYVNTYVLVCVHVSARYWHISTDDSCL